MQLEQFQSIEHLAGIEFAKALLDLEHTRFQSAKFLTDSTYENINADFGIFPTTLAYPVYFAGDIRYPENKIVVIGINPGFNESQYVKERQFLEKRGLFDGYCNLYGDYFKAEGKKPRYYQGVWRLLQRLFDISGDFDWDWFQEHLITLELVPYHSTYSAGITINDPQKYRDVYFQILIKLLTHINPRSPVLVNGYPTLRKVMTVNKKVINNYSDVLEIHEGESIATGRLAKKFQFVGLPFLSRPRQGGVDALVEEIRRIMPATDWRLD